MVMFNLSLRLLRALAVWESIMLGASAIMIIRSGAGVNAGALPFFGPALLFGVAVVAICSGAASLVSGGISALVGAGVGAVAFGACALVFASWSSGFKHVDWIFLAYLRLLIPSAVGGGIVGWLGRRRTREASSADLRF